MIPAASQKMPMKLTNIGRVFSGSRIKASPRAVAKTDRATVIQKAVRRPAGSSDPA